MLVLAMADITRQEVDAIVNAANESLRHGGGVAAVISRAAGPGFQEASSESVRKHGEVPTGEARATPAGELPCEYVIHAVGPIWGHHDGREGELLRSTYASALRVAGELGVRSIAFPSISTGVYGYPLEEAAPIALRALAEGAEKLDLVRLCVIDEDVLATYGAIADQLGIDARLAP